MSTETLPLLVRNAGAGERRWFYGGGQHTWLVRAEETGGAFLMVEDRMRGGKATPLHVHPHSDETFYVVEGEIVVHVDGTDHVVSAGGVAVAPRGVPHAFLVTSPEARVLWMHTPAACEAFYLSASVPGDEEGEVDLDRVRAAAADDPGIELLGPPPFARGPSS
jgi:quercetin dioxygenase-like cupin family protein